MKTLIFAAIACLAVQVAAATDSPVVWKLLDMKPSAKDLADKRNKKFVNHRIEKFPVALYELNEREMFSILLDTALSTTDGWDPKRRKLPVPFPDGRVKETQLGRNSDNVPPCYFFRASPFGETAFGGLVVVDRGLVALQVSCGDDLQVVVAPFYIGKRLVWASGYGNEPIMAN